MVKYVLNMVAKMPGSDVDDVQFGAGPVHGCYRIVALVITRKFAKASMEAICDAALSFRGEDRDKAGIDTARNTGADRHIAAQMHPDRIIEQLDETSLEIPSAVV